MSKHTPGPWVATDYNDCTKDRDEHYIFIEPGVAVIEKKVQGDRDWLDARLIAAAPELLELVLALIETREKHFISNEGDGLWGWDERARAAIAKATGES